MLKRTSAKSNRKKKVKSLRSDQRERVQDTRHLVQSARDSLSEVDDNLIPERKAIEDCFDLADRSLREALQPDKL